MNNQKFNKDLLDQRAYDLAVRLSELSLWDIKRVQEIIALYIKDILSDCSKPDKQGLQGKFESKLKDLEADYNNLKQALATPGIKRDKKIIIEKEISRIKPEIKKLNIVLNNMRDEENYHLLRRFVSTRYGKNVLEEFDEIRKRP